MKLNTMLLEEYLNEVMEGTRPCPPASHNDIRRAYSTVVQYNRTEDDGAWLFYVGVVENGIARAATQEEKDRVNRKLNTLYPQIVEMVRDLHIDYPNLWKCE